MAIKNGVLEFLRRESSDWTLLMLLSATIPLIWFFALGWRPGLITTGNDTYVAVYPFLQDLIDHGGDWTSLLYRPQLEGGIGIHNQIGSLPILRLVTWLGLTPGNCINISVFFFQLLFGFVGSRLVEDFVNLWSKEKAIETPSRVGIILLTSFAPLVGWRLIYGHFSILMGAMAFLCPLGIIVATRVKRLTCTFLVLNFVCLLHAFQSHGFQMVLYAAIFGFPIFIAAAWPEKSGLGVFQKGMEVIRNTRVALVVSVCAFFVSLPVVVGLFLNATNEGATRTLSTNMIYSYTTANWTDWIGSITWSNEFFETGRDPFLQHETNYPFGPLIVCMLFLLFTSSLRKKSRGMFLGLGLSLIGALVLSMNLRPFSSLLLSVCPVLRAFRVPARCIFPFAMTVLILGISGIVCSFRKEKTSYFWSYTFIPLLFFIPFDRIEFEWLEILCWLGVFWLLLKMVLDHQEKKSGRVFILICLGFGSIAGFRGRLIPYADENYLNNMPKIFSAQVTSQAPALLSPLTRAQIDSRISPFNLNDGLVTGVSSLDGYWLPLGRFNKLVGALSGQALPLGQQVFQFNSGSPGFGILSSLYNIRYAVTGAGRDVRVTSLGKASVEAWFGRGIKYVDDFSKLAEVLVQNSGDFQALTQNMPLVRQDSKVSSENLPEHWSEVCEKSKILRVESTAESQRVRLLTETMADCPLTISMNYVDLFKAKGRGLDGGWIDLQVFPAYGALAGLIVKKAQTEVVIEAFPVIPVWSKILEAMGWLGLLSVICWSLRSKLFI